jgi:hypothetical protein
VEAQLFAAADVTTAAAAEDACAWFQREKNFQNASLIV